MPIMSKVERSFCDNGAWRAFARKVVLPWVLPRQPLVGDVLEIGCGSGAMAEEMTSSCPGIQLTATDVDPFMVERARRRLATRSRVRVEVADVTALPFDDASFDTVTTFLMLHHVIQWQSALAEAGRVLRGGGLLIGYDLTDTRLARWTHRLDGSPHLMIAADDLRERLAASGFVDIEVTASGWGHLMRFRARRRVKTA